ncbi:MAG: DUF1638 domain-containing protein [Acidimicrobiales bacterium]|jgi:hypothetical protein|nr:DUF1638 domain-containing protein [Acidimicrobiales bacterium]
MVSETMPNSDTSSRTLVVACGALARELLDLIKVNGLETFDIECLPASYHNTPELIPEAVRDRVTQAKNEYQNIYVGYADCGTGGLLDKVCEELQVERLPGAHCYEFFAGSKQFSEIQDAEIGTFYLTDYLTRHFDRLVIQALWLDRHPELLKDYFGAYTRLVYLAQTNDPEIEQKARDAAERLGLKFELFYTGYGDLGSNIINLGPSPKQQLNEIS